MSLDLGKNRGYIQSISSGRALPSIEIFLEICEYLDITPTEFFCADSKSLLIQQADSLLQTLSDENIIAVIKILQQLQNNKLHP